jgi:PAS domain S-box-containing protein
MREQAVKEAIEGKSSILELALRLGVSTTTLRNWIRQSEIRAKSQGTVRRVAAALSAEKQIESSQRMRLLIHALEQSPATIIVTDAEGRIIYANPKFVETTGYDIEEAVGQTPRFLKSGHTTSNEYGELWKTIRNGREWRGEFHNRRKDGSFYWERASISPVFDADGKIGNFMAVKENITEYKEAEAARLRIEQRFRAVVQALAEGILLLEADGRILLSNPAAQNILQRTEPQLHGQNFSQLGLVWQSLDGSVLVPGTHPVDKVLVGMKQEIAAVCRLLGKDGTSRRLGVDVKPITVGEDEPAALLVSLRLVS